MGPERYPAAHLRPHAPAPSFSIHYYSLGSVLEKLGDPAVNTPPYAKVVQLSQQSTMGDGVEGFGKVKFCETQ